LKKKNETDLQDKHCFQGVVNTIPVKNKDKEKLLKKMKFSIIMKVK